MHIIKWVTKLGRGEQRKGMIFTIRCSSRDDTNIGGGGGAMTTRKKKNVTEGTHVSTDEKIIH